MTLRSSDSQSESDLDSIRNSCDVLLFTPLQAFFKFRFLLQNVSCEASSLLHKKMIHTNHGELIRIFDTYCRVWGAGGQATLTTSTKGGMLKAILDIQLGPPLAACPGGER